MLVLWWMAVLLVAPASCAAPHVIVALNTFKWLRLTSDKFLGFSVSPSLLTEQNYSASAITLLQGLAPTYLRVGENDVHDLNLESLTNVSGKSTLTESQWSSLNQFATDAGLRLIFSLNLNELGYWNNQSRRTLANNTVLEQLLSSSDQQGYDPVWQYGYKISSTLNGTYTLSGKELGEDVIALRDVLDKFPRYQKTAVLGPDFTINDKFNDLQFLKDFMIESNDIINVLVLKIKTQSKKHLEEDVFTSLSEPVIAMSKMLRMSSQSGRLKQLTKKQLWIAESDMEGYSGRFLDAMTWAVKLGHAGKLGYHVVLRRPTQLTKPTPDYWVSLLYRNLVGSAVLSTRLMSGHSTVTVFANCAAYYERAARSALVPTAEYERGAVVVWGINRGLDSAQVTLLTVSQEHAHMYALTASPEEMKPGKILLNGNQLLLTHGSLPKLKPLVQSTRNNMSVQVPAQSVFFIVLPHAGARACLSPAILSRQEELVNPQWEQWQNTKSLIISSEGLRRDLIFEKGGIYKSFEIVEKNKEALESGLIKSKDDKTVLGQVKEKGMLEVQQSIKNINEKLENFPKTDTFPNALKIKKSDSILKTVLPKSKGMQERLKNKTIENAEIDLKNISEASTSVPYKNNFFTGEEGNKLKNSRIKRSNIVESYREKTNYLPQLDISTLIRQLLDLQRNKPTDNTNSMLKFKTLGNYKPLFHSNQTVPEKCSQRSKETEMNRNHPVIHDTNLLNLEETINKNTAASKLLKSNGKENNNFFYNPGTFYETIGNLKINSNLSIADIEEQRDPFAVILKESVKCENCNSSLKVTKRPDNKEGIDRKIVESKTEYIEQYFKNTEELKKHNSLCANNNLKDIEYEHGYDENAADIDTSHSFVSEKPFVIKKKPKNISLKTSERIKRDSESFKYISQIFNKNASEDLSNNSTKISHPEEMQLRMFLQELTEEGEELLKSFDNEYEQLHFKSIDSEQNSLDYPDRSLVSNQKIVTNRGNKTVTVDVGSESNLYQNTNLITKNSTKPKRKHNSTVLVDFLYGSKNITNTNEQNVNLGKTNNAMLESLGGIGKQTERLSTTIPLKLGELNSTYSIHDLNSFPKLKLLDEEISEPNENSIKYSLTPKPFHNFFKSYKNSQLNQKLNSEEMNNTGTTIKTQNKFKPEEITFTTATIFTQLQQGKLNTSSTTESNTVDNLYLKIMLPDKVSRSNEKSSPHSVSSTFFQQPLKDLKVDQDKKIKNPIPESSDSIMSSQIIEKHLRGETKTLPTQTYRQLGEKRDTDVKESMIISSVSEMPKIPNLFLYKDSPKTEFESREVKLNQLNNLAPNLKLQDNTSSKMLVLNKYENKPIYFQNTQSKVNNLNNTTGLLSSNTETSSPFTVMLLNKQKERLEAFKEMLDKARERFQKRIHPIPNFPTINLLNARTNNMVGDFKRNNDFNKEDRLKQKKPNSLLATESKLSVKKQLNSNDEPLFYDSGLMNRIKRQISRIEVENHANQELTTVNSAQLDTPAYKKLINNEPLADIVIESSYTPIHKWIIPLSNHTEKIVMKNKIFPVKLFGVLSDDWQYQNEKKDDSVKGSERKLRSVRYSCMRDSFDDYSAEKESVDGIKVEKDIKPSHPSLSNDNLTEKKHSLLLSPENFNRNKRSVRNEANINSFDIKSRLMKKIKKERPINEGIIVENVSNDTSDQEPNNNTFSSMLQKQVEEVMENKTGVDRMFELAKLYQKTNPKSLEVFNSEGNIENPSSNADNSDEEENKALEVADSKDSEISIQRNLETFVGKLNCTNVKEKSISEQNKILATAKIGTTNESSKTSKLNIFSVLLGNIQGFFNKVNTVIRTIFSKVQPIKTI